MAACVYLVKDFMKYGNSENRFSQFYLSRETILLNYSIGNFQLYHLRLAVKISSFFLYFYENTSFFDHFLHLFQRLGLRCYASLKVH